MKRQRRARPKFSFWLKALGASALMLMADGFFFHHGVGATGGVFALVWLSLIVALKPALLQDRRSASAAAVAALLAALLLDRFTLVGWVLFWTATTVATLLPRSAALPDAIAWAKRLGVHALCGFATPIKDIARVKGLSAREGMLRAILLGAILPVGGGALFLGLFARANPLIAATLEAVRLPNLDFVVFVRVAFWLLVGVIVWGGLQPARRPTDWRKRPRPRTAGPWLLGVSTASVIAALALFNVIFALENGLDLAFLWSGAPLPKGVSLADYAHRGAYPLVLTALLAGGFLLLLLREGSPTASRPAVRWLVGAWVAQNVLLTASSILRTLDYVEAYSLTRLRLAALLWMGLVMFGLMLIGWRMLRAKSASWLINVNALALALVLIMVEVGDLGAVAAWWNVGHARDLGGRGAALDVCYLQELGSPGLLPLLQVERTGRDQVLRERAAVARQSVLTMLEFQQGNWHRWMLRDAYRLHRARTIIAGLPHQPDNLWKTVACDGLNAPPIRAIPSSKAINTPVASPPLTTGAHP